DLKHAEDDLRRMNLVMENVVDGIARLDADGRYLSVNRAYAAICGYEPEDLIGREWVATVHPEDWPTLQAAYQTMQQTGKVEVEARGLRQDGSMFYKQVTMIPNCDQQGQFIGHYCFLKDISDRKQTELALQENENTTRALIAAIPDFLVRMRQDGLQLQVINRGAIHALDTSSANAAQWVTDIMPAAIAHERIALAQRALATQQIQSQEYEFVSEGQTYYEEARIVPIWKDEVLVVVRDITLRKRNEIELRNLSDRLTLALNAGEIGTWDWALGDEAHWDKRIYEIYGWPSQEQPVTYENWRQCVEPEDLVKIEALLQQAIAGTAEFAIEFRIYRPDGEMRWVKTSAMVQRNSDGQALRMIGINYDITARKQAELDLKSAKDQLELVLQASSEGFWDWNLVTGEIYFSPAWKAMLGYTDCELDNSVETWASVIFADDRSSVLRLIEDYNSGQVDQFNITQRFHHKDGSTVYILSRAIHLKDEQGNVVRMVGSHLDMTHLVQIQNELQTSEMLLSGILNSSLDGIMAFRAVRDPQGALIDFEWLLNNPASCTITGRQAEDLIGKRLLEEFPGHRPSGLYDFYVEVVETGEPMQRQFYYNHDGINSWFENIAVPLGDGFAVTFRDITLVKESEMAMQQINQQLKERISDLDQRHTEMLVLGEISDFLQACLTVEEACNTIANLVEPLFPHCAGGIFTTSPSRNRLENVATWGSSLNSPLHSTLEFQPQSCWGLRRGRMHWVGQNRSSLRCSHIPANEAIAATLCIPMIAQGETLGLFYLSTETANALSEAKQQLARTLAEQVGMAIANLNLRETLQHQSIRDPLTGLFNRRYLEESLTQEIVRAQRHRHPIGVIMIDIDHFKRFNDIFGHDVGDYVLQTVGALLKDSVRNSDIACRYGGEEMTLILPEASLEGTTARAEMIREAISQLRISQSGKLLDAITASFGVACFPQHGSTSTSLIKAADIALYRAKDAGRNQVLVAL
ncbi:MAG TPA: diguanylate cyclase, partial [Chroococcidiopsis sp.]